MPIRFKCPHCEKTLGVKDHLAGKKANCPACKKPIKIPDGPPPATVLEQPAAPTVLEPNAEAPPVEAPPAADVEAAAMSVFADEPKQEAPAEAPQAITFTCNWCAEEVTLPAELAGKQAPCPNPECKRIVKVPLPKAPEKKDWRDATKRGPSGAAISQIEKLDNVISSRDDKAKVSTRALIEAGVVQLPPKPSIGVRGWIRRGLIGTTAACVLAALLVVGSRLHSDHQLKKQARDILPTAEELKLAKFETPLPLAELHRGVALIQIRSGKLTDALTNFRTARSQLTGDADKTDRAGAIDRDLLLIELALAQLELGGSEDEVLSKLKLSWKDANEILKELSQTLQLIKAPEARAWAAREIGSRLIDKGEAQANLAIQLATKIDARSQMLALAFKAERKQMLATLSKEPDLAKDNVDLVARVGYAEGYARKGKGSYDTALAIAKAKGYPRDQLEALVGIAAVIASMSKSTSELDEARPFLGEALLAADAAIAFAVQKKAPSAAHPWALLQLVRLAARVDAMPSVDDLHKRLGPGLPAEFKSRAEFEGFLAKCEKAKEATPPRQVEDLGKSETITALALEATARQHAWLGHGPNDILEYTEKGDNARYRPMVKLGLALGQRFSGP